MILKKKLKIILIYALVLVIFFAAYKILKKRNEELSPLFSIETFNMSDYTKYKKLIGQEYETQIDLVIINRKDDRNSYLLVSPDGFDSSSLDEIKEAAKFPYEYDIFTRIFGILPPKSRIKIVNVFKSRITKLGQSHDSPPRLQGEIISEGKFSGTKVLLHELTNFKYWTMELIA